MSSKKTIIIASAVICLLLLTILYMDYRIRNLEGKSPVETQTTTETKGDEISIDMTQTDATENKTTETSTETTSTTNTSTKTETTKQIELGTLNIISYPDGAAVYMNDKQIGKAPYINYSIPVGNYTIKVIKAGYGDYCKKAYVYKGKIEKITALLSNQSIGCSGSSSSSSDDDEDTDEEDATDTTDTGMTKFVSVPSGTEVKVNGVLKGVTPISLKLTEGEQVLKMSKSGYKQYTIFFNVDKNGMITSLDPDSEQGGNSTKEDDWEYEFSLEKN